MTWFLLIVLINVFVFAFVGGVSWFALKRLHSCAAFVLEIIYKKLNKPTPKLSGKWFGIVYAVSTIPLFLAFLPVPMPLGLKYAFRVFGAYWTGVFVYLLMLLVLAEVIMLIARLFAGKQRHTLLQKLRQWVTLSACVLSLLVSTYGFINARFLRIASYEIQLSTPLQGEPMTIVFISDLHLSEVHTESWLPRIVRSINALDPDLVVMIGDIFNDDFYLIRNPYKASKHLRGINATYGVFANLGNHDAGPTVHSMMAFLAESNITLLNCDFAIIDERLVLIGRVDPFPSNRSYGFGEIKRRELAYILYDVQAELSTRTLPELPIVVIDHNPLNIPEYGSEVDLVLFGHTHRGQFFPGNIITDIIFEVSHGHRPATQSTPHIIVTQGVHTWLIPMRVGTSNEIGKVIIR